MGYTACVRDYTARLTGYTALLGYTACVQGYTALLKGFAVYAARLTGYTARLKGYAAIMGYIARLKGYTTRLKGYTTRLKGYAARLKGYTARFKSLHWTHGCLKFAKCDASFICSLSGVVTQINFSNGPGLAQHTDTRKKHTHTQTTDCAEPVQMYVWKGTLFQQHNDDQEAIEIHTQTNLLTTVKNRNLRLDS